MLQGPSTFAATVLLLAHKFNPTSAAIYGILEEGIHYKISKLLLQSFTFGEGRPDLVGSR